MPFPGMTAEQSARLIDNARRMQAVARELAPRMRALRHLGLSTRALPAAAIEEARFRQVKIDQAAERIAAARAAMQKL